MLSLGSDMLSKKDKSFLNVARYLATKSEARNTHGAVVVAGRRVVGMGWNKDKNHPNLIEEAKIKEYCSAHAEQIALREAGDNASKAVLYVARVSKQGEDRDSKPCHVCQSRIIQAGIKRVVYTMEAGEINYVS
jgi:deoxycytidylate deaminase